MRTEPSKPAPFIRHIAAAVPSYYAVEGLREALFYAEMPMLARNLLYTGMTRGKQLVVLIGQPKACALAVRNVRAMRRLTNLTARLRLGGKALGTRE